MFSIVCSLIYLPSVFSNPQPTYREDVVQATPIVHVANRAVVGEALHLGDVSSAWTSWRPWRMQVLSLKTIKLGTSRWSRVMLLAVGG